MPHVSFLALGQTRQNQLFIFDALVVSARDPPPRFILCVEVIEFDRKRGGLNLVEPAVHSLVFVVVLLLTAVVAQSADDLGKFRVARGDSAGVAKRPEIFGRIEAEAARVPEATGPAPSVRRSRRLCGVFN